MDATVPKLNILAIYAHPADVACEGAGTIALHTERGDDVSCLVLSDGERHHNDIIHREYQKLPPERDSAVMNANVDDVKRFKRAETERICDILGIGERFLFGWPDYYWECSHERIEQIAEVVRQVRPDVVLAHLPWGESQIQLSDIHALAGHLSRMAIRYCSDSLPQLDGHEPHHTKLVFYFPMMGMADTAFMAGTGIVCDIWIDITSVVAKKLHAIDQLVSQGYQGRCARKIVEAREGRWGMLCGCSYAEPWIRDRAPRYAHLPVRHVDLVKQYVPNDVPGLDMVCPGIATEIPEDGFRFP